MQAPATITKIYLPTADARDEKTAALYRHMGLTANEVRKVISSPLRINRNTLFQLGLFVLLAFIFLAPQHAFTSTGTGGSLPYEGWL
jgi:hypothetical protein